GDRERAQAGARVLRVSGGHAGEPVDDTYQCCRNSKRHGRRGGSQERDRHLFHVRTQEVRRRGGLPSPCTSAEMCERCVPTGRTNLMRRPDLVETSYCLPTTRSWCGSSPPATRWNP